MFFEGEGAPYYISGVHLGPNQYSRFLAQFTSGRQLGVIKVPPDRAKRVGGYWLVYGSPEDIDAATRKPLVRERATTEFRWPKIHGDRLLVAEAVDILRPEERPHIEIVYAATVLGFVLEVMLSRALAEADAYDLVLVQVG